MIIEYENGTIAVQKHGEMVTPAKAILRELATALNISILYSGSCTKLNLNLSVVNHDCLTSLAIWMHWLILLILAF